ncbi:HAL/PAL/TAL family ammonia-lyase [Vaginella massiliensis]|uniref:HAL/PAL/TAL family ammonia-lyase n=1 Tax=Vaginella massiliensis TaxID=1816680 RepID=UPI0008387CA4|nr:aromatic amino acid ammonia-lyase [Vaginella massiliensis]
MNPNPILMPFADIEAVVFHQQPLAFDHETKNQVQKSFDFLQSFIQDKIIYGVNTGFGPMAQYRIADDQRLQLQYNLIRSHATGQGNLLSPEMVRASLVARYNTLSLGYSGVHPSVLELMKELINREIYPVIFAHGGVGASGDLVQLAHMALCLIGEGEVWYKGERQETKKVFELEKLSPIEMHIREGLSIMNGTAVMSGIGVVNLHYAYKLLKLAIQASCLVNELVAAYDDHFSVELNRAKLHEGQLWVAEQMQEFLHDSENIRSRQAHLYSGQNTEEIFSVKVQEYYSLRCVPQILGPVKDCLAGVEQILVQEINSASDNPIVDLEQGQVYHGGNFHGDYVAFEMDKMKLAITKLSMLMERQLNYILNSKINEILPPFVNLGKLGFNFGMQGAQFTATSTTAENQTLSNSMYIHSIPNNNDNQDVVSMGTNAAVICNQVIENTFEVLAIHLMSIAQAIEARDLQRKLSTNSRKFYREIRNIVPAVYDDIILYPYIKQLKDYIKNA